MSYSKTIRSVYLSDMLGHDELFGAALCAASARVILKHPEEIQRLEAMRFAICRLSGDAPFAGSPYLELAMSVGAGIDAHPAHPGLADGLFSAATTPRDAAAGAYHLINVLPLTPSTETILNKDLFACQPPGARPVQIGWGEHLVEGDLIAAPYREQLLPSSVRSRRRKTSRSGQHRRCGSRRMLPAIPGLTSLPPRLSKRPVPCGRTWSEGSASTARAFKTVPSKRKTL